MGVQSESLLLPRTAVVEFNALARQVQARAERFVQASEGLETTKDETRDVVVLESTLEAVVQSLVACKDSVDQAIDFFMNQKLAMDNSKHDMTEPASMAASSTNEGQANDQPDLTGNDEAITKTGVYATEVESEHEATDASAAQQAENFPKEILLENVNHLMFVIHGIGQHDDFVEKPFDEESRQKGESSNFRELFSTMRDSLFAKEIPLSLEIVPVEWHAQVHKSGADDVFDSICPDDSKMLRGINRRLVMDVLYYSAPKYGQMIIDSVTKQMNDKYNNFKKINPNWTGFISIFAHSLGTLISYDILSHDAGQVGANGVVFHGLAFPVENLFCAGSPVPIFELSRGHLDIHDGKCTGGMRRPKVNHYFNLFHPADPIAYRVEPLINVNMAPYPAVTLEQSDSFKYKTFGEMVQVVDKLTEESKMAKDWMGPRIDFQVRREGWDWFTGDFYAPLSHSVYWSSQDVVTITLMAICRPVVDILTRYIDHKIPLPTLRPRRLVPFTPYKKIKIATTTQVRDGSTGAWHSRAVFLARKRVYFTPSAADVACTKKYSLAFTANSIVEEDASNPRVIRFTADQSDPSSATQTLKCASTTQRQEWMAAMRAALANFQSGKSATTSYVQTHGLDLPSGTDVAFFDAELTSTLQYKWGLFWYNAWYVLTKTSLDCYDTCPAIVNWEHFSLKNVFANPTHGHFRLVNRTGTSVTFKIEEQAQFNAWVEAIKEFENHSLTFEEECN
ncbi:Aste57867_10830 [Aphanomyces stellatus]|uniref:Aste57867_10830 protein n=1 Tax=Aphanomyces stellatus TaxID=120398 RepID=A0A485KRH9_9STRA|nr:hypothetical protein As57867_010790 [Aphanomyces stellatus]VFT87698.1 Aste57867_10830 [Aphanomyces stellatus]